MNIQVGGGEINTARLGAIQVRAVDLDLAALSGATLYELGRCFKRNLRKCASALFNKAKKRLRDGLGQIERQLVAEAERRGCPEPGPGAAPLTLTFERVEDAGCFCAFCQGLEQVYLSERAEIPRQGQIERSILDTKSVAFECARFCGLIARAINETEVGE